MGAEHTAIDDDPEEFRQVIADAIDDSMDIDWTSSVGARAVFDALRDRLYPDAALAKASATGREG